MAIRVRTVQERMDDQGRLDPLTPEELAAQAEALQETFRLMDAIPDDDPPGSDEAYLRQLNRKYEYSARWLARRNEYHLRGIARRWLQGFSLMLASSGWRRATRKTRPRPRSASGSQLSESDQMSASPRSPDTRPAAI